MAADETADPEQTAVDEQLDRARKALSTVVGGIVQAIKVYPMGSAGIHRDVTPSDREEASRLIQSVYANFERHTNSSRLSIYSLSAALVSTTQALRDISREGSRFNQITDGMRVMWPDHSHDALFQRTFGRGDRSVPYYVPKAAEYIGTLADELLIQLSVKTPSPIRGAHEFYVRGGKFEARNTQASTPTPDITEQMLEAIREGVAALLDAIEENYRDPLIEGLLTRILADTSRPISELPIGRLRIELLRIQALSASYSDPSRESDRTLSALTSSLGDELQTLLSTLPVVHEIRAGELALGLTSGAEDAANEPAEQIIDELQISEIVGHSAVEALTEEDDDLASLTAVLADPRTSVSARTATVRAQSRIRSQRLLNIYNFSATLMRLASDEFRKTAIESLRSVRDAVPEALGEATKDLVRGGVRLGLVMLAAHLAGPLAALALSIPSFDPLAKRAKSFAEDSAE